VLACLQSGDGHLSVEIVWRKEFHRIHGLVTEKFGDALDELQFWWPGSDYPLEDAVNRFGDRYAIAAGIDHTRTLLLGSRRAW